MAKLTPKDLDAIKTNAQGDGDTWIKVGLSTCGIAAGADVVFATFIEEAKKRNLSIAVKRCGCQGMCYAEPLVEVKTKGLPPVIYGKVTKEVAMKILEKHVCSNQLVKDHIYEFRSK